MNRALQTTKYIFADIISSGFAWYLFFNFRKEVIEPAKFGYPVPIEYDDRFYAGLVLIPLFWTSLYALLGMYKNIYRRHRLKELGQVMFSNLIGVIILFFAVLIDDQIANYQNYYRSILFLLVAHFSLTFTFRFILTTRTVKQIHKRVIGFNTLLVGGNQKALKVYDEMETMVPGPGFNFIGYISLNGKDQLIEDELPWLGSFQDVESVVAKEGIEEVIIAVEKSEQQKLGQVLSRLENLRVRIKIIPDIYDILAGSVKMTSIFGAPLIAISTQIMPEWQLFLKRLMDISASLFALVVLSPVYFAVALIVKLTSPGPIIFKQERIGQFNKPFFIYKFRSMRQDAESGTPKLAKEGDPRITPFGRFMRKTRLDELPQFFNVIKGDMSLVGPRPERQYFIDQIMEVAPHYRHLQKVKPGITSWGQVKYGYAENVNEMVQRLKYDVLYIENMSLAIDFKIMAYTILTVLKGDGK
ncbi:MAG: sugar transferase [Flavobacteriales bacterium]|nr:sugar transferase [Flavobacteriales bacterium]